MNTAKTNTDIMQMLTDLCLKHTKYGQKELNWFCENKTAENASNKDELKAAALISFLDLVISENKEMADLGWEIVESMTKTCKDIAVLLRLPPELYTYDDTMVDGDVVLNLLKNEISAICLKRGK